MRGERTAGNYSTPPWTLKGKRILGSDGREGVEKDVMAKVMKTVEYDRLLGHGNKPGRLWTNLSKIVRFEPCAWLCFTCRSRFKTSSKGLPLSHAGHCTGGRSKARLPDAFITSYLNWACYGDTHEYLPDSLDELTKILCPLGTPWYLFFPLLQPQCPQCNAGVKASYRSRNQGHGMYAEFQKRLVEDEIISQSLLDRYKGLSKSGGKRPSLEELYRLDEIYTKVLKGELP